MSPNWLYCVNNCVCVCVCVIINKKVAKNIPPFTPSERQKLLIVHTGTLSPVVAQQVELQLATSDNTSFKQTKLVPGVTLQTSFRPDVSF